MSAADSVTARVRVRVRLRFAILKADNGDPKSNGCAYSGDPHYNYAIR